MADIYRVREFLSPWLAFPAMLLAFCVSCLVAALSNLLTRKRRSSMFRHWTADTDPVEVRVEAYGLGRMAGMSGEKSRVQIPFDILEHLAEQYRIPADQLTRPFMTGVLNGMKERSTPEPAPGKPHREGKK